MVTIAALNAAAEVFKFLSSEQGQAMVGDIRKINADFAAKVSGLFDMIHDKAKAGV